MSDAERGALSQLGTSVLAWLLSQKSGGTPNAIAKVLVPIQREKRTEGELRPLVEDCVAELEGQGWLSRVRRQSVVLTQSGKRVILDALDWPKLPSDSDWGDVKRRLLACTFHKEPSRKETVAPPAEPLDERVEVLARRYQLDIGDKPTLEQAYSALLWRAMGSPTARPFTVLEAIRACLNRLLGAETLEQFSIDQALDKLSAQASAIPQLGVPGAPGAIPSRGKGSSLPADDATFAKRVLEAARASKTGRFGDDKVFISHVLQQLRKSGFRIDDEVALKDRLISAHRGGLLKLRRADLVEAMEPRDVDASEVNHLSDSYHFVLV